MSLESSEISEGAVFGSTVKTDLGIYATIGPTRGALSALSDAPKVSRVCSEDFSNFARKLSVSAASTVPRFDDFILLQPQVFEVSKQLAESISTLMPPMDSSGVSEAFRRAHESYRFLEILDKSQWPLFLEDGEELLCSLLMLDADADPGELKGSVGCIAEKYLDNKWMAEIKGRWASFGVLNSEEKNLLLNACERHESGDYIGSVAVLMCLFEGFVERYHQASSELAKVDQRLFDWGAKKYSLCSLLKKNGKKRSLNIKDQVLLLLLQADSGWYTWEKAVSYIVNIVLGNKYDEGIAAHNPMRNKICHGSQTNYGTWEHSAKAILATDMLLRLGSVAVVS